MLSFFKKLFGLNKPDTIKVEPTQVTPPARVSAFSVPLTDQITDSVTAAKPAEPKKNNGNRRRPNNRQKPKTAAPKAANPVKATQAETRKPAPKPNKPKTAK